MDADEARRRLARARVARLATITATGTTHLVPICFAVIGETIYNAVDDKPKRSSRLQRLANVRAGGASAVASVLVDHWAEDWSELWWVRADGRGRVLDSAGPEADQAH